MFHSRTRFILAPTVDTLHRSSHDGTVEAEYQLEGYRLFVRPGARAWQPCLLRDRVRGRRDGERDEIIALDAQTLQLRHRFASG